MNMWASGASELRNIFTFSHAKTAIFFNILLVLQILCLRNIFPLSLVWYYITTVYRQSTSIEKMYMCDREERASLDFFSHFHILKLLFPSIFCWYFRYFVSETYLFYFIQNDSQGSRWSKIVFGAGLFEQYSTLSLNIWLLKSWNKYLISSCRFQKQFNYPWITFFFGHPTWWGGGGTCPPPGAPPVELYATAPERHGSISLDGHHWRVFFSSWGGLGGPWMISMKKTGPVLM